ncbi:peptidase [Bordetella genomosp. 1]|uniref:Peptidase n=1 Tax=Bordetella genomosp. 1 TaxID=1395607 RepID=A0A261RSP4_9BORD|nr:proteasome-type protease [Bordetella genomosp. 1]MDQ8032809.1 proteasome-type protease [Bordetella sp.]OZI28088.1 peptidase [Bordetella genomosp. 1]OZI68185.1 peptidase [Bordetella genomosp. 1]
MTYCIAAQLNQGLVFLSDSRTNAGVDQISIFRKLSVFELPGERVMVLMTSGNLALSQAVVNTLAQENANRPDSIWRVPNMFEAARRVGDAVRQVHDRDAAALREQGVEFNINLIFGGQIGHEGCRLFQIYAAGNFIEATPECPYFQIGESKYGKPILDRVLDPDTSLDEAAKCALISMDSTLRSNISVGLPLDLLVYATDELRVSHFASIDDQNEYFSMIRSTWGERLRQVFAEIPDPLWAQPENPDSLVPSHRVHQPVRIAPLGMNVSNDFPCPQSLAEGHSGPQAS